MARTEEEVRNLLLQLGQGLNWINLFSILDSLQTYSMRRSRKYFDIVLKSCNYTRKDVSAFTGVANHFGLIGVLSRHGELKKGIPKDQMSLRESQILILSLCKSFLKSTYGLG